MADAVLPALIGALTRQVTFLEVRTPAQRGDYFEAVLSRGDLPTCENVLVASLGQPVKAFGRPATLAPAHQHSVNKLGGVRGNQCLFLKAMDASVVAYALLWPWESDPMRVTIKVGHFTA
ncbi:MAG: hypothetical protein HY352_01085 [Candidatus Omnitrophica bacterium]|nr:hypothetical protein [Candidatus Omnitrophota bacterium]